MRPGGNAFPPYDLVLELNRSHDPGSNPNQANVFCGQKRVVYNWPWCNLHIGRVQLAETTSLHSLAGPPGQLSAHNLLAKALHELSTSWLMPVQDGWWATVGTEAAGNITCLGGECMLVNPLPQCSMNTAAYDWTFQTGSKIWRESMKKMNRWMHLKSWPHSFNTTTFTVRQLVHLQPVQWPCQSQSHPLSQPSSV